jgi:hypothetical protein
VAHLPSVTHTCDFHVTTHVRALLIIVVGSLLHWVVLLCPPRSDLVTTCGSYISLLVLLLTLIANLYIGQVILVITIDSTSNAI